MYKKLVVSAITSTTLIGGGVTVALLHPKKPKEITKVNFKNKLISQGYKEETNYGAKARLLKQYGEFAKGIGSPSEWCKKNEDIQENGDENLIQKFKEICFETIASKIEGNDFAILKAGSDDEEEDAQNWKESLEKFKKDFETNSDSKPSSNWTNTQELKDFQKQCKKNERTTFTNDKEPIFTEVKKYCTRRIEYSNTHHG